MITERITDAGIMEITDEQLLLDITGLLGREFVCYGYKKVCKYLILLSCNKQWQYLRIMHVCRCDRNLLCIHMIDVNGSM